MGFIYLMNLTFIKRNKNNVQEFFHCLLFADLIDLDNPYEAASKTRLAVSSSREIFY